MQEWPNIKWEGGSYQTSLKLARRMLDQGIINGDFDATITKCSACGRTIPPARPGYEICSSCERESNRKWAEWDKRKKEEENEASARSREACRLSYLCQRCKEKPKKCPFLYCEDCLTV